MVKWDTNTLFRILTFQSGTHPSFGILLFNRQNKLHLFYWSLLQTSLFKSPNLSFMPKFVRIELEIHCQKPTLSCKSFDISLFTLTKVFLCPSWVMICFCGFLRFLLCTNCSLMCGWDNLVLKAVCSVRTPAFISNVDFLD